MASAAFDTVMAPPAPGQTAAASVGVTPFKLTLRKDTRRWTPPARLTYEALVDGVRAAYELPPERELRLTYADVDDDQVTIVGDEDMQELYLQSLPVVRVTVTLKNNGKRNAAGDETSDDEPTDGTAAAKKQKQMKLAAGGDNRTPDEKRAARLAKLEVKAANGNPKAKAKLNALRSKLPVGHEGGADCAHMLSKLTVSGSGAEPSGHVAKLWKSDKVEMFLGNLNKFLPRAATRQPALIKVANMLNNACDKVDCAARNRILKALAGNAQQHPTVLLKLRALAGPGAPDLGEPAVPELKPLAKQMVIQAIESTPAPIPGADAPPSHQPAPESAGPAAPKLWKPQQVDNVADKLAKFLPRIPHRQPALAKVSHMLNNSATKADEAGRARVVKALAAVARRNPAVLAKLQAMAGPGASPSEGEPAVPELVPVAKQMVVQAIGEATTTAGEDEDVPMDEPVSDVKLWKPHQADNFLTKLNQVLPLVATRLPALGKVARMVTKCQVKAGDATRARIHQALSLAAKRDLAVQEKLRQLATAPEALGLPLELPAAARAMLLAAVNQAAAQPSAPPADASVIDNAVFV